MLVLTVVFRPDPVPNGTLSTLEAGLGTLVSQGSIEHTTGYQLFRSLECMRELLEQLNLLPGLRIVFVIVVKSVDYGSQC